MRNCESRHDCSHCVSHCYEICMLAQAFGPSCALEKHIDAEFVRKMMAIKPLAEEEGLIVALEGPRALGLHVPCSGRRRELRPQRRQRLQKMLLWWRNTKAELPAWPSGRRRRGSCSR